MPAFSGVYYLPGDPPDSWRSQLDALATAAGLKVLVASKTGRTLRVVVHVPAGSAVPTNEVASSFLLDAASVVSREPTSNGRAKLVTTSLVANPSGFQASRIFGVLGLALVGVLPVFIYFNDRLSLVAKVLLSTMNGVVLFGGFLAWIAGFGARLRKSFAEEERVQDAVRERVLTQEVEKEEDPKLVARLELARIALRSRASLMRGDADRLWRRSIWAYRGAFAFFLLASAGPGVAAAILLTSTNPDWHFMFGGLSLAAVPLGIGTALLRHDAKLREQYQQAAQDVASLERYELALDYARIASQETYQTTMQQVIRQLLLGRQNMSTQAQGGATVSGKESEPEPGLNVQKIIDLTAEKTNEVVAAIAPKKGA